ncbi:MAG: hypothetical protein HZC22_05045 [Rhodocyclales bacterium]|nr:hypothetical protein [Rhodocyclales bacterium]
MELSALRVTEHRYVFAGVGLGLLVSVVLAWPAPADYVLANATFFWGSQLAVLAVIAFFRPSPLVIAGAAIALAIFLAAFGAWVFSLPHSEGEVWIGYVICLPGALIGAKLASDFVVRRFDLSALRAVSAVTGMVLAGIAANLAIVAMALHA